jgi:putative redox protein
MALITATLTHPHFGFTVTDATGNTMKIDIPKDAGGNGEGMRPMQTVLAALCGCSGVDVISILKKQRQTFNKLVISVDGEREKDKELSLWETIFIRFDLEGAVEPLKAYRAVELSIIKYCSVAETLRRAGAAITFSVYVNEKKVDG